MRTRFMVAVLLSLLLAAGGSTHAQQKPPDPSGWRKFVANGLELYSNASPERARWLAERCASLQADYNAVGLFPPREEESSDAGAPRLQVLHFKDLASYLPFRITAERRPFI